MVITWSEISAHLGAMAFNATLVALVVGGGSISLFRDHLLTSEYAEGQQKTLRAVLQNKVAEAHRRVLNWHAKRLLGTETPETDLSAMDPVEDLTNEIFRSTILLRRFDGIRRKARQIRSCVLFCTIGALVGFLLALAFEALRPFFSLAAIILLAVEVWMVLRSRACKREMEGANEAM